MDSTDYRAEPIFGVFGKRGVKGLNRHTSPKTINPTTGCAIQATTMDNSIQPTNSVTEGSFFAL